RGEPVDITVLLKHLGTLAIDIHKPARVRPVHQFSAAAVAVRVGVADIIDLPNDTAGMQVFCDLLVDVPNIFSLPIPFSKETIFINRMNDRDALFLSQGKVFFAVSWSNMNGTGTVVSADIVGMPNLMSTLAAIGKEGFIGFSN